MVPLQCEVARNGLRGGGADMPGNQIEHEVVPRHRGAGGDELVALAGDDQHALGQQRHPREGLGECLGIAPVNRRLPAVEQTGLGQQEDARAGRAQQRALRVHAPRPRDDLRIAAGLPAFRGEQDGRHDDDVGRVDVGDRPARLQRHAARQRDTAGRGGHDLDRERRLVGNRRLDAGEHAKGVQHVVDAGQRRNDRIRNGNEADMQRARLAGHHVHLMAQMNRCWPISHSTQRPTTVISRAQSAAPKPRNSAMERTMTVNQQKLEELHGRLFGEISAGYGGVMVALGDKLGLYKAMAGAGPLSSHEVARRSGCGERYVREWLNSQVAGGYVTYHSAFGDLRADAGAGDHARRRDEPVLPAVRLAGRRARCGPTRRNRSPRSRPERV